MRSLKRSGGACQERTETTKACSKGVVGPSNPCGMYAVLDNAVAQHKLPSCCKWNNSKLSSRWHCKRARHQQSGPAHAEISRVLPDQALRRTTFKQSLVDMSQLALQATFWAMRIPGRKEARSPNLSSAESRRACARRLWAVCRSLPARLSSSLNLLSNLQQQAT